MNPIVSGILEVLTPINMLFMLAGTLGGLIVGALPGLTATMACAIMVPFTFTMPPLSGLATLGAIYMAAIYGGSFSAILVNAPGTPSSIGTCFDGYPMAKQGRGQEAIVAATVASVIGGLAGVVALALLAPPLAAIAIRFGPPEYFWVAIFGLTIISTLSAKSPLKGFIGGCLGVLLSMIGISPVGGDVRFTFGIPTLQGGIELICGLIGLFCIPEVLSLIIQEEGEVERLKPKKERGIIGKTTREVLKQRLNLIRSSILGVVIGIMPGAGGSIANLVAYNEAKRASKHPEKFGTGIIDGVIATETANNATVGGGLIPLLTLGIPGTPTAAVIYGALLIHGLRPGKDLFTIHASTTYGFIFSILIATLMMLVVGLAVGSGLNELLSRLPVRILAPSISLLCIIGSYAIRNNVTDVFIMLMFGVAGYIIKQLEIDSGAVVLGLILGPIAEEGFVQALLMSKALPMPWTIFFTRPLSILLIALSALSLFWPLISKQKAKHLEREEGLNV
ncbi:MAG TPA: tripartite tricarboxylate transporter permease [Bacillota bacterium]|jgi:putative tricarboxylic transport membrane protein|nr:tripartite tricarboxylate transporter permease [Bacillota bacterium]